MKNQSADNENNSFRIVITDSGLGGLSVQALLDRELRICCRELNIELIYFNALADRNLGYNSISDPDEKVRIFDSALAGISNFNPDMILIACNTLSVIYQFTRFSKETKIKVIGIIESGIDLIMTNLDKSHSNILLLGTETTIFSNAHKNRLLEKGIDRKNIIPQACKLLESEIQEDSKSQKVEYLIMKYIEEAEAKIVNHNDKTIAVLCCTHYFFSKDIFIRILKNKFGDNTEVLDPNMRMVEDVILSIDEYCGEKNQKRCSVTNKVFSKLKLSRNEIISLGDILKPISVDLQRALLTYEHKVDIFTLN